MATFVIIFVLAACISCVTSFGCTNPASFPHGTMLAEFGFCTVFRCDSGYILSGFERRCCIAGVWIPSALPSCILAQVIPATTPVTTPATVVSTAIPTGPPTTEMTCSDPPTVANSQQSPSSGPYPCGVVVTYSCSNGYELSGHGQLTCSTSGSWTGVVPSCVPKTCIAITSLANGEVLPSNGPWTFGSTLTFTCNQGFSLTGSSSIVCQQDGTWTSGVPACINDRTGDDFCVLPTNSAGMNIAPIKDKYESSEMVVFWCSDGYVRKGPSVIQCGSGGVWSAQPPTCNPVSCGAVPPITNGYFTPNLSSYPFGQIVNYMCNTGFAVSSGNLRITCQTDGSWSGTAPTCKESTCSSPAQSANSISQPTAGPYVAGTVVVSVCNTGYQQTGGSNQRVCEAAGSWSGTPIVCTKQGSGNDCLRPPFILNGGHRPNQPGYAATTSIQYFCNTGFKLASGSASLTCFEDGSWKGTVPVCVPDTQITCNDPPSISHGSALLQRSQYLPGDVVFYTCDTGYSITAGNSRLTCRPDGLWEGTAPTCSAQGADRCAPPAPTANGRFLPDRTSYATGEATFYFCNPGYSLTVGNRWLTCQQGGIWQGIVPLCIKDDADQNCGPPPTITQGSYLPKQTSYNVGDYVYYYCEPSHRLVAQRSRIQCQADGTWENVNMYCSAFTDTRCPPPSQISLSTYNPVRSSYSVGEHVYYVCLSAYNQPLNSNPTQTAVRICGADGMWYGPQPKCTDTTPGARCLPPPQTPNAVFQPVRSLYIPGETVTYTCSSGSILNGIRAQIVCSSTGKWIGNTPICTAGQCRTPPPVPNASHSPDKTLFATGEQVLYTCATGFYLSGNPIISCSSGGSWLGSLPSCNRDQCSLPPNINNGLYSPSKSFYSLGERVYYQCSAGYVAVGSTTLTCSNQGFWSSQAPACILSGQTTCRAPPIVANGRYNPIRLVYATSERVTYQCTPGYSRVAGDLELVCQGDGTWYGTAPTCAYGVQNCDPSVVRIANGFHTPRKATYVVGDRVYFECNDGFKRIAGDLKIRCGQNGQWIGQPSVCQSEGCRPPPGSICSYTPQRSAYNTNDVITYTCPTGYVITSSYDSITCHGNNRWSNPPPSAQRQGCTAPVFSSGYISPQKAMYMVGETISFTCASGTVIDGAPHLTCLSDGRWSGSVPMCNQITCSRPMLPLRASAALKDTYFPGERVNYMCEPGYQLGGSLANIECQTNGRWTTPGAQCTAMLCSQPSVVNFATFKPQTGPFKPGDEVIYSCMIGYQLASGNGVLRCTSRSSWDGETPVCKRVFCGTPPSMSGGSYTPQKRSYTVNELVTYSCDNSLRMTGENTLRCMPCGSWSPSTPPQCRAEPCQTPPSINRGTYSPQRSSYTSGETVTYSCNSGYLLTGNSRIRCTSQGYWDLPAPTCSQIRCSAPPTLDNGRSTPNLSSYQAGDKVTYTCNSGYQISGNTEFTCGNSGSWIGNLPTCTAIQCGRPPVVPSASYTPDYASYRVGETVTYRCSSGYLLSGDAVLTCQQQGIWSGTPPTCTRPAECDPPSSVSNANYLPIKAKYAVGDRVTYTCAAGHEKSSGDDFVTCSRSLDWTGTLPVCTPKPPECMKPPVVSQASYSPEKVTYAIGDVVTYMCSTGYSISTSSSQITCLSDGRWSTPTPVCTSTGCAAPPSVANAGYSQMKSSYFHNEVVVYTCNTGYQIGANDRLTCSSGNWIGTTPTCSRTFRDCSFPPTVASASYNPQRGVYRHGDIVVYTCATGYRISLNDRLSCQDGIWTGANPSCIPTNERTGCIAPPVPSGGSYSPMTGGVYEVGSTVTYSCAPGYELVGVDKNKCLASGEWEYSVVGQCSDILARINCMGREYLALRRSSQQQSGSDICNRFGMQMYVPSSLNEFICICDELIEQGYAADFFWTGVRQTGSSFSTQCNQEFYDKAIDEQAPKQGSCLALQNDRIYYRSCLSTYNILCEQKTNGCLTG